MFNIQYDAGTGEIISYQEGNDPTHESEIGAGCKLLILPNPIDLYEKIVNIHTMEITQKPQMLIGISGNKALAQEARKAPNGCIVELGVYQGGSAIFLAAVAQEQGRALHLFDTFSGIPDGTIEDGVDWGDFSDTSLERVKSLIPDAVYHVGKFPDTLTDDVQEIAFIHADCDLYGGMKAIKTQLWDRMVPGAMIFFHDYDELTGVKKAVDEDFPDAIYHKETRMMLVIKGA